MKLISLLRLFLVVSFMFATSPVWSSTIYTYTGNNFDTFDSVGSLPSHDASMSVSVALEYTDPLSFNLTEQLRVPISFSISDGINTIDNTTASSWNVRLGTDALGQINSWFVYAVRSYCGGSLSESF